MRGHRISVVVLAALVAAGAYTVLLLSLPTRDPLLDWGHALIATVLSVFVALGTGLYLFEQEKRYRDAEDKAADEAVLRNVIARYQRVLDEEPADEITMWNFDRQVLLTYFEPTPFELVAQRGHYSGETTGALLEAARLCRLVNLRTSQLLGMMGPVSTAGGAGSHLMNPVADRLEETQEFLNATLDALAEELRFEPYTGPPVEIEPALWERLRKAHGSYISALLGDEEDEKP